MYKLNVTSQFSAAHKLVGYDGKCKNMHGHNWKVRVGILCKDIDEIGMAIDFTVIKKSLDSAMEYLDHKYLNDLDEFKEKNPTSENLAKFLFDFLSEDIKKEGCNVVEIEIWESDRSSVVYTQND